MISNPLLTTGLLLFLGYLGGRLANVFNLPRITGYLLVGLIFSPSLFHILDYETVNNKLHFINDIALAIIAFNVGGSLEIRALKGLGYQISIITLFQALGAFLITFLSLFILGKLCPTLLSIETINMKTWLAVSLIIGAICAATAPGAVLAIISELGASGEFTNILLGVIALDDALTIILFSIVGVSCQSILGSALDVNLAFLPLLEIGLSFIIGIASGIIIVITGRLIDRKEAMLMVILGILFIATSTSNIFHASSILTNMIIGFVVVNHTYNLQGFFNALDTLEDSIFGLFFTLAGAHIDINILKTTGILAIIILIVRMAGKQLGVIFGAKLSNASLQVSRYLGLALFPQAGVTIGLVLLAQDLFPKNVGIIIVNSVIGSVILNEFIAPVLLHHCLKKAGQLKVNHED